MDVTAAMRVEGRRQARLFEAFNRNAGASTSRVLTCGKLWKTLALGSRDC